MVERRKTSVTAAETMAGVVVARWRRWRRRKRWRGSRAVALALSWTVDAHVLVGNPAARGPGVRFVVVTYGLCGPGAGGGEGRRGIPRALYRAIGERPRLPALPLPSRVLPLAARLAAVSGGITVVGSPLGRVCCFAFGRSMAVTTRGWGALSVRVGYGAITGAIERPGAKRRKRAARLALWPVRMNDRAGPGRRAAIVVPVRRGGGGLAAGRCALVGIGLSCGTIRSHGDVLCLFDSTDLASTRRRASERTSFTSREKVLGW